MKCTHSVKTENGSRQCKCNAIERYNLCQQHGWLRKYYIGFSWQENPGDHWTQKKKAIWPILFETRELAHAHMISVCVFANMGNKRKLTACVEYTKSRHPSKELNLV